MHAARTIPLAALALTVPSTAALAHVGDHLGTSLVAGLAHPVTGLDHVLAMVAVGLWASQLGRRAMLLLPAVFPLVMALGAVMGVQGMTLPWVEAAIILSVVALGAAVALGWRISIPLSAVLVGTFALFHGYAHGAEFGSGSALLYGTGFVLATLVLHLIGLGIGTLANRPLLMRTAGSAIATAGLLLIVTL
jgi:urease accessory protein